MINASGYDIDSAGGTSVLCDVWVCVSDLGLRHDIEVVVVRREGHVSEDGSILHRLHRLILQSTRGAVYPDLEKHRSTLIYLCIIFLITAVFTLPLRNYNNNNIKKKHSKPNMKYIIKTVLEIGLLLPFKFIESVLTVQKVLIVRYQSYYFNFTDL